LFVTPPDASVRAEPLDAPEYRRIGVVLSRQLSRPSRCSPRRLDK